MSRLRVAVAAVAFVAVTITTGFVAVAAMPLRGSSLASSSTSSELPMLVSRYFIGKGMATPIRSSIVARLQFSQSPTVPDAPRRQINKVYPEYPKDALERGIKGIVVVDVTVNAAGDVSTAAVASGPQELRASALTTALGLKFTPGSSVVAMKISMDYTLTANSWGVRIWDSTADGTRVGPIVYSSRGPENPMPAAARVGGGVRPPRKIKDAPPVYPVEAQAARVQGVVILEARVDETGNVSHTHVLRSIPLLDQAAVDSVKQWQYEPTLLNGVPIPVIMTVTVNFTLRPVVRMHVVLPDGQQLVLGQVPGAPMTLDAPGVGRYQVRTSRAQNDDDLMVSLFAEDGQRHVGDVTVTIDGPVVQTPTVPSIGLQLIRTP